MISKFYAGDIQFFNLDLFCGACNNSCNFLRQFDVWRRKEKPEWCDLSNSSSSPFYFIPCPVAPIHPRWFTTFVYAQKCNTYRGFRLHVSLNTDWISDVGPVQL